MRLLSRMGMVCCVAAIGLDTRWVQGAPPRVPPVESRAGKAPPKTEEQATATLPTAQELEPLVIPSSTTVVTTFALDLDKACSSLLDDSKAKITGKVGHAAAGAASLRAALSGKQRTDPPLQNLRHTCDALVLGTLQPEDWQNLEDFRDDEDTRTLAELIETQRAAAQSDPSSLSLSSIGSIVDDAIGGLEKFLYDRAKAEAALYLSARLKAKLCAAEHKPFFPNLCVALGDVELNLPLGALGTYLIGAARKDLHQFPDTSLAYALHDFVEGGSNGAALTCKPNREVACNSFFGARLALTSYRAVSSGRAPLDVARGLYLMTPSFNPAPRVLATVKNGSALVDAVFTQESWKQITSPAETQKVGCYTAAIYLSLKQTVRPSEVLPLDIRPAKRALPALAVVLSQAIQRSEAALSRAAQANAGNLPQDGDVAPPPGAGNAPSATGSALSLRDHALAATQMLQAAIDVRVSDAFFGVQNAEYIQTLRSVAALGEAMAARDDSVQITLHALALLRQLLESQEGTQVQRDRLRKAQALVPLLTQLASAKSADEAANVFQTAAVSVDTYAIKYEKAMTTFNGFVGVAGGSEFVNVSDETRGTGITAGLAPVGFHASWPFGNGHWHVGAMVSVIDLGALITARFESDVETETMTGTDGMPAMPSSSTTTVPKEPEVDLINLVSPGFFVTLGIYNSPFVVGVGARVLPGRKTQSVAADGATSTSSTPAVQILGTIAVDVPILQF